MQRLFFFSDAFELRFRTPRRILGSPLPLGQGIAGAAAGSDPPARGWCSPWWDPAVGPAAMLGCRWSRPRLPAGRGQEFSSTVAFMQIFCCFRCPRCVVQGEHPVLCHCPFHPRARCARTNKTDMSHFLERIRKLTKEREDPLVWGDQNAALPSSREQRLSLTWTIEVL